MFSINMSIFCFTKIPSIDSFLTVFGYIIKTANLGTLLLRLDFMLFEF